MQLKTLLNLVHPAKGYVYQKQRLIPGPDSTNGAYLEVSLRPRRGTRGICSGCGRRGATYDTQSPRSFQFVPLWGIAVALVYAMRRIDCWHCGAAVRTYSTDACSGARGANLPCRSGWLHARLYRDPESRSGVLILINGAGESRSVALTLPGRVSAYERVDSGDGASIHGRGRALRGVFPAGEVQVYVVTLVWEPGKAVQAAAMGQ